MSNEMTYASSGVNIDEASRALRGVGEKIKATQTENVVGGLGGFGALFKAAFPGMTNPLIVSSIDGVGTKTKVAAMAGDYSNLGKDIVNHCVNDILCQGAKPLFFLDYFATSRLSADVFESVVTGMADACLEVECALIGGETAEMPGVYVEGEIDIGIASNGLHTNGFSLARRALFEVGGLSVRDEREDLEGNIGEVLLKPHRCYFNSVYPLLNQPTIHAIAHLTGGGFFDNIPRVLPSNAKVLIEKRSWTPAPIFNLIQETGQITEAEMYRTFNMGIGMVLIVDRFAAQGIVDILGEMGEHAAVIGEVQLGSRDVQLI
jgi:phosphoribosylformylglycinamidine cyclo-ligase